MREKDFIRLWYQACPFISLSYQNAVVTTPNGVWIYFGDRPVVFHFYDHLDDFFILGDYFGITGIDLVRQELGIVGSVTNNSLFGERLEKDKFYLVIPDEKKVIQCPKPLQELLQREDEAIREIIIEEKRKSI